PLALAGDYNSSTHDPLNRIRTKIEIPLSRIQEETRFRRNIVTPRTTEFQTSRTSEPTLYNRDFLVNGLPYFKILLFSSICLSLLYTYVFVANDLHNVHFDSKGHQMIARRILDNLTPGFKQI